MTLQAKEAAIKVLVEQREELRREKERIGRDIADTIRVINEQKALLETLQDDGGRVFAEICGLDKQIAELRREAAA